MIGKLTGNISEKRDSNLILDVAGVGYLVHCPDFILKNSDIGSSKELFIHTVVRETALDLYGFDTNSELELFELLLTISGIGPKVGLGILNVATPETLVSAISTGDTSYLTKVSGIGKKNAEKIVLELKNKIEKISISVDTDANPDLEVFEALTTLGFTSKQIQESLKEIPEVETSREKIKEVLKIIGK